MSYEIIWTDDAKRDLRKIVYYLRDNFGPSQATSVATHIYARVDGLMTLPHAGSVCPYSPWCERGILTLVCKQLQRLFPS